MSRFAYLLNIRRWQSVVFTNCFVMSVNHDGMTSIMVIPNLRQGRCKGR